jgi:TIR domain
MDDRMGVYISHSAEDSAFSIQLAWALRGAGMDAWCDVHVSDKHVPGPALREVSARPIFILVLSPAALTSTWVRAEYERATETGRVILPVVIAPINADQWPGGWARLFEGGRAADQGLVPLSHWDAIVKTLELLLSRHVPANGAFSSAAPDARAFYTSGRLLREQAAELLRTDENAVELLIERGRAYSPPGDGEIPTGPYAI